MSVDVYCWRCRAHLVRPVTGLYRRCDECRSTDVHVITSVEDVTLTRADVAAAIERHRGRATTSR
jgi:hypothetical protein